MGRMKGPVLPPGCIALAAILIVAFVAFAVIELAWRLLFQSWGLEPVSFGLGLFGGFLIGLLVWWLASGEVDLRPMG